MSVNLSQAMTAIGDLAPLWLAEEWDNVGLLMSSTTARPIDRILLTIDLTDAVADEAVRKRAALVIAYHPPIFDGIKRIPRGLARLIEQRVAVYSPHTALDAVEGGVNDWLCDGLGEGAREPLVCADDDPPCMDECKIVVFVPAANADRLRDALATAGAGRIGNYTRCSFNLEGVGTFYGNESASPRVGAKQRLERVGEIRMEMVCPTRLLPEVAEAIRKSHPYEEPAWDIYPMRPKLLTNTGAGRKLVLDRSIPIRSLVDRVRKHLRLKHVRVALAPKKRRVKTIAVCAGAGGSLLKSRDADVYLTGEMRHHDVLAAVECGTSVILCDHTNTERGYLPVLKKKLREKLGKGVKVDIARSDAEPLRIV